MASRGEMVELFGVDEVVAPPRSLVDELGGGVVDLDPLIAVGLPRRLRGIFDLGQDGDPEAFSVFPVVSGSRKINFVVIGAPNPGSSMRYMVDPDKGYVVLLDLGSNKPQVEVINESIGNFIEFVYRVARFRRFYGLTEGDRILSSDYKEMMVAYFMSLDSFAMKKDTNWWPMVFERVL